VKCGDYAEMLRALSCAELKGAFGAHILSTSTKQLAVNALMPLSLWVRSCCDASSFATCAKEFGSVDSWSRLMSSLANRPRRLCSVSVAIGLPELHPVTLPFLPPAPPLRRAHLFVHAPCYTSAQFSLMEALRRWKLVCVVAGE
jgi:hypothetical protein